MTVILAALVFGYLMGSVPYGLILTRAAGLGDIRAIGSGNIGATNVLRTGNKKLAAATLLADALKGTAAALIAAAWGRDPAIAAGLGAFLGHVFPVWLGFRGGKGVATYIGVLLGLHWPAMLVFAVVWLGSAYLTRYSSLSALLAVVAVPFATWLVPGVAAEPRLALVFAAMSVLVFIKHKGNIERLRAGTEARIGAKS
jgi:glycerol-3-phosphate acyltransferase PlsY